MIFGDLFVYVERYGVEGGWLFANCNLIVDIGGFKVGTLVDEIDIDKEANTMSFCDKTFHLRDFGIDCYRCAF